MASDKEKREKLIHFLDEKAFDPILEKSEDDFEGNKRDKYRDVRQSTESEKERFHNDYNTAEEVRDNYLSDLNSEEADKINRELEDLGLPRLPDFEGEFRDLCDRLDVK